LTGMLYNTQRWLEHALTLTAKWTHGGERGREVSSEEAPTGK
jgi:hypothetical protein